MIAFFRRTLASKLALGLLALIMLAFIVTGVFTHEVPGASSLTGDSGDTLATVGKRKITSTEMEDRIRRQYASYAQQQPGLTLAQFVATGGFDAVVDQSISAIALDEFGTRIGLAASDRQVDGQIATIPAFQGPTGKFDQAVYRAALAQQHIPEQSLRRDIASDTVRQMMMLPTTGAVTLPDGMLKPYASLLVETRKGTIGLVPTAAMGAAKPASDAELANFYKTHTAAYSMPERRVLRYAVIGRDQVAGQAIPTEAEIRKVYDGAPDKYGAHESRTLSQVVLPDQAAAAAFAAKVKGGTSFADAAKAGGFSAADIAIGKKTQAEFAKTIGQAAAAAAFAAPQGGLAGPVKSDFGWNVIKVEAIERSAATPYATARPQIAGDLAKSKQDTALAAKINAMQDAIDGGQSFADVAKANGLAVIETPPLTATGQVPGDATYKPAAEVQPLLKPGFDAATDGSTTVETIQQGERYALLAVGKAIPAAPLPLAQVKAKVAADFAAQRASDQAKAIAQAILAKVKAGTTMADAFAKAPVKLPAPQEGSGTRLQLSQARMGIPAGLRTLFTMPVGTVRLVPDDKGLGWYVVQLQTIVPPDPKMLPPLIQASRGDLVKATADEYVQQLANAAGDMVGIRRNQPAIAALRARLLGATPATMP